MNNRSRIDTAEKIAGANTPRPFDGAEDAAQHPGCTMPRFDTRDDAYAAGYEGAKRGLLMSRDGYDIRVMDVSGESSFGYDFAVKAIPSPRALRAGHRILGPFGQSVGVALDKEPNRLKRLGSVAAMWAPGALTRAVDEALAAVDSANAMV